MARRWTTSRRMYYRDEYNQTKGKHLGNPGSEQEEFSESSEEPPATTSGGKYADIIEKGDNIEIFSDDSFKWRQATVADVRDDGVVLVRYEAEDRRHPLRAFRTVQERWPLCVLMRVAKKRSVWTGEMIPLDQWVKHNKTQERKERHKQTFGSMLPSTSARPLRHNMRARDRNGNMSSYKRATPINTRPQRRQTSGSPWTTTERRFRRRPRSLSSPGRNRRHTLRDFGRKRPARRPIPSSRARHEPHFYHPPVDPEYGMSPPFNSPRQSRNASPIKNVTKQHRGRRAKWRPQRADHSPTTPYSEAVNALSALRSLTSSAHSQDSPGDKKGLPPYIFDESALQYDMQNPNLGPMSYSNADQRRDINHTKSLLARTRGDLERTRSELDEFGNDENALIREFLSKEAGVLKEYVERTSKSIELERNALTQEMNLLKTKREQMLQLIKHYEKHEKKLASRRKAAERDGRTANKFKSGLGTFSTPDADDEEKPFTEDLQPMADQDINYAAKARDRANELCGAIGNERSQLQTELKYADEEIARVLRDLQRLDAETEKLNQVKKMFASKDSIRKLSVGDLMKNMALFDQITNSPRAKRSSGASDTEGT